MTRAITVVVVGLLSGCLNFGEVKDQVVCAKWIATAATGTDSTRVFMAKECQDYKVWLTSSGGAPYSRVEK